MKKFLNNIILIIFIIPIFLTNVYAESLKNISPDVVKKIGLEKPFYENVTLIENPNSILVLCNKYNKLSENYAPDDLTDIGDGFKMKKEASENFLKMREDMKKDNIYIAVRSTYRSFERQNTIHKKYVRERGQAQTDLFSARPGHSEHQTGLAIDLVQTGKSYNSLSQYEFENTKQYEWMLKNAANYGFILRYPKGFEDVTGYKFEPWHWRYVGSEVAKDMKEKRVNTFDEYVAIHLSDDDNLALNN